MRWHKGELQVKTQLMGQWQSYRTLPSHLQKSDHGIKLTIGSPSKGFATMQNLLKLGWRYE